MAVKPIPEGQTSVTPHLTVKGAAQAIEYYKKTFGAQEIHRMPGPDGRIMHAALKLGDTFVFLNDEFPEMGGKSPQTLGGSPVTLNYYVPDADAVFKKAVDGGAKVKMPIDDQFWGDRYGIVIDPFGHEWVIATRKEDLSPQEMERRGKEFMSQPQGQMRDNR